MTRGTSQRSPLLANSAFSGLDLWSHKVFKTNPHAIVLNSPSLPAIHTLPDLSTISARKVVFESPSSANSDASITSFGERESFETAREEAADTATSVPIVVSPPRTSSLGAIHVPSSLSTTIPASNMIELGAPVPNTPESPRTERRKSWQKTRGAIANWAKPSWLAEEEQAPMTEEAVRIFGVSLQRSRRIRTPVTPVSPTFTGTIETPAMSDDEESAFSTPPPETPFDFSGATNAPLLDIPETPALEEVFTEGPALKGLGLSNVTGLEKLAAPAEPVIPPTQFAPFTLEFPSPPPRPSRAARPTFRAMPSMDNMGSPSTLEELRNLRQAAVDLHSQVRKSAAAPTTKASESSKARRKAPPMLPAPSAPLPRTPRATVAPPAFVLAPAVSTAGESSRKIKRKAVPVFLQSAATISPLRTPEYHSSASNSPRGSISAPEVLPTPLPVPELAPTAEVVEVTSRVASLPFSVPPRSTSARRGSVSDDSGSLSSASGSSVEGPSTPSSSSTRVFAAVPRTGIYANKKPGAFMSMLDLSSFRSSEPITRKAPAPAAPEHKRSASSGFYAAKDAFRSVLDLSSIRKNNDEHKRSASGGLYAVKGAFMSVLDLSALKKGNEEVAVVKQKRSLARFFGRK